MRQIRAQLQAADPSSRDVGLAATVATLGALAEKQSRNRNSALPVDSYMDIMRMVVLSTTVDSINQNGPICNRR